jgi:hypothetical protein
MVKNKSRGSRAAPAKTGDAPGFSSQDRRAVEHDAVIRESFLLPPGIEMDYYSLTSGRNFMRRTLIPLERKTSCIMEYHVPDREVREAILKKDQEKLVEIGPREILDDCWYIEGTVPALLTAPHAAGPRSDEGVSDLVFRAQGDSGAHAILATLSRKIIDFNNISLVAEPFFEKIQDVIDHGAKTLVDVHSMGGNKKHDIEIGSLFGETISERKRNALKEILEDAGFNVAIDVKWIGGAVIGIFSKDIETVQLEFSRSIVKSDAARDALCAIVKMLAQDE